MPANILPAGVYFMRILAEVSRGNSAPSEDVVVTVP